MQVPFNVDAFTARLIGRENVSKLDGAILELVKNAYDADASMCILYYEESTGSVYLIDNGSGMTEQVINENWMTIGYSSKKSKYKLPSGRIQTGAKGIGRFALDRISDKCTMLSKTSESSIEWIVDWADFDIGKKITEVGAEFKNVTYEFNDFFKSIKNSELKKLCAESLSSRGTVFKLNSLRESWSDELLQNTKKSLATLMPPEIVDIFQIYVFSENSTIADSKVLANDGVYSYDYKIEFNVEEDGKTTISIHRDEFDFGNDFDEIMQEGGFTNHDINYFKGFPITNELNLEEVLPKIKTNTIGAFSGVFYFSKLSMTKDDRKIYFYKDISSRQNLRGSFGGIKIYRDNFRVRPYGEPKSTASDWLLLSNRRSKSPAAVSGQGPWRVGADQMLGSVHISRTNLTLPDQSNREGIVETKEFGLLREFIISVIQEMERDRQYVCRLLRKRYDTKNETQKAENEILEKAKIQESLKEKQLNNSRPQNSQEKTNKAQAENEDIYVEAEKAKAVIEEKKTIIKELEDENRLLRALATTGIVTNTYIHEIKSAMHLLGLEILAAERAINKCKPSEDIALHINKAINLQESFHSWFKVTIEMVKRNKREMQDIDMEPFLTNVINSWADVLKNKNIEIKMQTDKILFRCFPYDIESILGNLIANSKESFKRGGIKDHIININVIKEENSLVINYSDNGKGLDLKYKKEPHIILEPFQTSIRNPQDELIGTGMGMWIIDKTVKEYKGSIDLSNNINLNEGFYIKIKLKGAIQ